MTLRITDTYYQNALNYAECLYAEWHVLYFVMLSVGLLVMLNVTMLSVIMLSVIMLNVIMLNVIMLNVIMLNVEVPNKYNSPQFAETISLIILKNIFKFICLETVARTK
jgi:hypothetical protein